MYCSASLVQKHPLAIQHSILNSARCTYYIQVKLLEFGYIVRYTRKKNSCTVG